MAQESIRPGWAYKSDNTTANYVDNHVRLQGSCTTLKIFNDGANPLEFMINREEDSIKVDGEVPAGQVVELNDIDQGLWSVAVKGATATAYRLWAYH